MSMDMVMTPTDFVALLNQTLEYAYPLVKIEGELSNFRVSRNKWVYFDIKDDISSVKCFGSVYSLPGPLQDGIKVQITATPRLHPQYNFSLSFQTIIPVGEGSIKKAAELLKTKLTTEGLFAPERKRSFAYPPEHIALVAAKQSAGYADFIKILNSRWGGIRVSHKDVQVQGDQATSDIVNAIDIVNQLEDIPDVLVILRGGGSVDDLATFSTEQVTRAVATSRAPTLVAIGHEIDESLAELAADKRASTPSNAAELLVPDKAEVLRSVKLKQKSLLQLSLGKVNEQAILLKQSKTLLKQATHKTLDYAGGNLARQATLLEALDPKAPLRRGYTLVKTQEGKYVKSVKTLQPNQMVTIQFSDGSADGHINEVN